MKVKDLLKEIKECQRDFGDDFLEWDVYTEQCDKIDKKQKKKMGHWKIVKDSEGWEYFECVGFWTKFPKEKIFTINVNY